MSPWPLDRIQWLSTMTTTACNNKIRFSGLVAHMCFAKIHQFGFSSGGGEDESQGSGATYQLSRTNRDINFVYCRSKIPFSRLLPTYPPVYTDHLSRTPCTGDFTLRRKNTFSSRHRSICSCIARRSRQTGAKLLSLVLSCKSFLERPRV